MSIQFINQTSESELTAKIAAMIARQDLNYKTWKIAESVIVKFDGQKITKRIATALSKELPDYTVYYDTNHGMYDLVIWGNGIPYDNRISIYLGYVYDNNAIVNIDKVRELNTCHELELGRMELLLSLPAAELQAAISSWNTALAELQRIHKWAEKYGLEYTGFDIATR